jgi:RNA polymerase primary sigma factor
MRSCSVRTAARRRWHSALGLKTYLEDIGATALLSHQEERQLAERIAQGDPHARDHLIRANLRLVVNIARGYIGRGLPLEDLIAEGNLGLIRAVESYDGRPGVRFIVYASFWIKQSIRRAVIMQGKLVRLPAHVAVLLSKWRRASETLTNRLGREPAAEEVGWALCLSKRKQSLVIQTLRVNYSTARSDVPGESDESAIAFLVDERAMVAEDLLIEADELEWIEGALECLEEREATVLRMRFGIEPYAPMTGSEVGRKLGLTRERVRQIEKGAIARLFAEMDRPTRRRNTAPAVVL